MRSSVLFMSVALVLAAGALSACGKPKSATTSADQPLTATVANVQLRALDGGLSASGMLVSKEEAAVTTELSGYRVAEVLVDQGATVSAGQPLARLDDTLLKSQIAQAEAAVATQAANAERTDAEARRVAGLDHQGVLSQEQIDERRLAARTGQAQLASARAQLADLRVREGLMTVRAPVAGRVLDRTVRPGDVATPSMVMFRMARDGVVELNAEVPENLLANVHPGDKAEVTLSDSSTVTGVVRLISPQVDTQSRLGHIRVTLPVQANIRAGGFGRAHFAAASASVLTVPEKAVEFDANGASVLVADATDHVHRFKVRTGQRSGGYVELVQGPPAGARVVLGGGAFLLDGDHVRTVGAPAQ